MPRLVDNVYDEIYALISTGRIKPGDWLRQAIIADEMKVSQVTVREALNKLVAAGIAERVPRKGVRIPSINIDDLMDIYNLRMTAERTAWQAAAELISAADLKRMHSLLPRTGTTADPASVNTARVKNHEFHMIAIEASGRYTLIHVLNQLLNLNNLRYLLSATTEEARITDGQKNIREHSALLDALETHNCIQVSTLIESHIKNSMEARLALLNQPLPTKD
jgi:GntR family transcriptional regulator, rspAB operon transcriptional repressor